MKMRGSSPRLRVPGDVILLIVGCRVAHAASSAIAALYRAAAECHLEPLPRLESMECFA